MRTRVTVTLLNHSQNLVVPISRSECYENFRSAFADGHKLWLITDEDGDLFVFVMNQIQMVVCQDWSNV